MDTISTYFNILPHELRRKNNPEQYQAKNVKGCSEDRVAFASFGVQSTGAFSGRCKSFGAKGYGFITMDDGTELFFNVKDCVGSKPAAGDLLRFDMADSQMKPGNKEAGSGKMDQDW